MDEFECPECGADHFTSAKGLGLHRRFKHDVLGRDATAALQRDALAGEEVTTTEPAPGDDSASDPGDFDTAETRPGGNAPRETIAPRKLAQRHFGHKEPKGSAAPRTAETRPQLRRVSTAELWGDAVSGASWLAARAEQVPLARAMSFTAPVAGDIVENATKGGIIDKIVQPIARNQGKWADLADVLGLWVAVALASNVPEQAGPAEIIARRSLTRMLPRIAKKVVKERQRERDAAEAVLEIMPELEQMGLDMNDPIGGLWAMMFAAPPAPSMNGSVPEPEGAVA